MIKRIPQRATLIALLAVVGVGPVLYPAWLAIRTRGIRDPSPPDPDVWPPVTVVVPAYREGAVIRAKVDNTLANAYRGELEVLVVAEDSETAFEARLTAARVIGEGARLGKAGALNLGLAAARTPVVVLTDANSMLEPGSIARLVRWLDDATIGAVAGEKRLTGGEGAYWAFESWLKRREWRTGTTIGVGGELVALRREAFRELPPDVAVDDLWLALDIVEGDRRVAYEPRAVALETAGSSVGGDWERRTRVVAGMLDCLWRRRSLLVPGRAPVTGQLWGHRLVRSSAGPVAYAILLAAAVHAAPRSVSARLFLGVNAFGAWSHVRERRGGRAPNLGRLLGQALFMQAVGVGGTIRFLRRERLAKWPKPERTTIRAHED